MFCVFFFFFQAEDGIRDKLVTGVQTCALPICITGPHPVAAGTFGLTPANIVTIDPAGRGVNPAMVPYMNLFPHGNSPSAGRDNGLAFTGFVFNAPTSTSNNIYTMRLDYKITSDGRHTIFGRGILAGIK